MLVVADQVHLQVRFQRSDATHLGFTQGALQPKWGSWGMCNMDALIWAVSQTTMSPRRTTTGSGSHSAACLASLQLDVC